MTRNTQPSPKPFKLETLALANQPNTCIAQLARDLGLRRNMIYKWRIELNQNKIKPLKEPPIPPTQHITANTSGATAKQTTCKKTLNCLLNGV
ncbi:MAG: transposase [Candidatus Thiodubiliella endoseptemdiera]|uniref:Transposase n=1 Tax=Candidatus Thiodubiliella endoseptemdiera TaxID=2738886 RepID=A0A853EYL4_9GAMM|nr:transposase [Candidatus Thiodubiliella endoseptemdiera]